MEHLLRRIANELSLVAGRPRVVAEACAALRKELQDPSLAEARRTAQEQLASLLHTARGELAHIVFTEVAEHLRAGEDPTRLAASLLKSREPEIRRSTADMVLDRWLTEELPLDFELAENLANTLLELPSGADPAPLDAAATLWRAFPPEATGGDPLEAWMVHTEAPGCRRLAAQLLDRDGEPVPTERLERLLGAEGAGVLRGLLQYTRASHVDLVDLMPEGRLDAAVIADFADAVEQLGQGGLGAVVGELGWRAFGYGVWVERRIGLSVDGGFPLVVSPAEAGRLAERASVRQVWDQHLVVAHGGQSASRSDAAAEDPGIQLFRRYNLLHAELLGEILEFAPVTPAKVQRILRRLDEVVSIYGTLFADLAEDAGRLAEFYAELRAPIAASCVDQPDDQVLDPETTRLVQMFEDPRRLDEVHTLHGLKRYLHQHGLRLAFRRFRSSRATNRTVDLAVVAGGRVAHTLRRIRYIDFEPDDRRRGIPFFPALLVEALGRRLLHGAVEGPDLEVLSYGNEIQTFVEFRNHPAFLRIDLSPPLRGGMIDLEYYGVSQYELEHHPDLSLPWIQHIFRRLDFDAQADGVRLHIRYDKERAVDLADLIRGVRLLASLLPHLMEVDWFLGRLRYPEPVRAAIADHWARWIERRGILPLDELLTADRRAILQDLRDSAVGTEEIPWDGRGEVRDRYAGRGDPEILDTLVRDGDADDAAERQDAQLPRLFAALLTDGGRPLEDAARLAAAVAAVERHLRFVTVGSVQGYPVQRALLLLPGETLDIAVLRDVNGIVRLASVREGPFPLRPGPSPRRAPDQDPAAELQPADLMARLRSANYVAAAAEPRVDIDERERKLLPRLFAVTNPLTVPVPGPGERTLTGIVAAPGKATGAAIFYRPELAADDVDGCVLFAPALRPEDSPLLRRAAAVVSTGGGILSHAGLIAQELGKPALVVEGRWRAGDAGRPALLCHTVDYREVEGEAGGYQVTARCDQTEREEVLREGDLVVVDADLGHLGVLGQDRDALAMQEELRRLDAVFAELDRVEEGPALLAVRGRLLHATHQLHRLLARLDRPVLARHAAHELLHRQRPLSAATVGTTSDEGGSAGLLRHLFANPRCGAVAREAATGAVSFLERRFLALRAEALEAVAAATTRQEVLFLRRAVGRLQRSLAAAQRALQPAAEAAGTAAAADPADPGGLAELDRLARDRLAWLREQHQRALAHDLEDSRAWWRLRARQHATADLDALLGPAALRQTELRLRERARAAVIAGEQRALARHHGQAIVRDTSGGLELAPLIGAKAAGLGEISRVLGPGAVPPWFAVSDATFRGVLAAGIGRGDPALELRPGTPLVLAIGQVLQTPGLAARAQAAAIRDLWRSVAIPAAAADQIRAAYRDLATPGSADEAGGEPLVAIRSSTLEEDSSRCSWAGQFDSFLCVRGEEAVLEHLRLAWASLWSERVLGYRQTLAGRADRRTADQTDAWDPASRPGGGVIVQRLVDSRAAGVLHTLSAASGQPREMVLNVGLGFGEGVVSGTVEVDQVIVSRSGDLGDEPLRFRYTVGDKRSRVVCDCRPGLGTCIEETLYHQRLRPALEYTDLVDLVRAAVQLEAAYARPLDLEFAFEADRLYVLQARPIVAFEEALQEAGEESPWRNP